MGIRMELPEEGVEAGVRTTFKIHFNRYVDEKGLDGYVPIADRWG